MTGELRKADENVLTGGIAEYRRKYFDIRRIQPENRIKMIHSGRGNGRMRNDRKTVSRGTAEKPHNSETKTRRTQTPSPESYQEEIRGKHAYLVKLLGKYGRVEPVIAMEDPLHYRNKVHAVFGRDGSGRIRCGEYKEGTHKIIEPKDSPIEDLKCRDIIQTVRKLVISFRIKVYDEDLRTGFLRHVVVRRGFQSGEIMVVLVGTSFEFPSGKNFVKELLARHPEITTVVLNINDRRTNAVLGDRERVLFGKGYITDTLCGCRFRISAQSFYQVNPVQTEKLYRTAIRYADLKEGETALDAYCGTGTIGIIAAKLCEGEGEEKKSRSGAVVGVERNKEAVADARINAKNNSVENITFIAADATEYMERLAASQSSGENGKEAQKQRSDRKIDAVFMDPPRSGADERFLRAAAALSPSRIVYISCGPESLARDLAVLVRSGYKVRKIQPVDMFPFVDHVETVVLLTRHI